MSVEKEFEKDFDEKDGQYRDNLAAKLLTEANKKKREQKSVYKRVAELNKNGCSTVKSFLFGLKIETQEALEVIFNQHTKYYLKNPINLCKYVGN